MTSQEFINKYMDSRQEGQVIIPVIRTIYFSDIKSLSDAASYEKIKDFAGKASMGPFIDRLTKERHIRSVEAYRRRYSKQMTDFFYFIIRMMKYSESEAIKEFLSFKLDDYISVVSEYIFPDITKFRQYIDSDALTLEDCFSYMYTEWHKNRSLNRYRAQRALFYLFILPIKYANNRSISLLLKKED